ncbi:MAG: signal recognition particle-docking protein FtsY [Acidobacteria bacterium]|nr:MAG: signal recognition particle-docking protein FtsY [Acidobacteriota bacterium]
MGKKKGFFSRFSRKKKQEQIQSQKDQLPEELQPTPDTQQIAENTKLVEDPLSKQGSSVAEPETEVPFTVSSSLDSNEPLLEQEHPVLERERAENTEQEAIQNDERPVQGKKKFFARLKAGLSKTRNSLKGKLSGVFSVGRKIDDDLYEELEEMLITSDLGVQTSIELIEEVRKTVDKKQLKDGEQLKKEIKSLVVEILKKNPSQPLSLDKKPMIGLIVGVNGVGKTTTIGKLATHWNRQGKKVLICAADTFRAAAIEQLQIWADRADVDIVMKPESTDPASVVFDALRRAKNEAVDVLLIDTAGRLHNNPNLMKELEKIKKIIGREFEGAPHHVFLILDAITGQNGLEQAKQFVSKVSVSDLVITKLDGTAKGGVSVAISNELKLPIRFIGVGERPDDLLPFDPEQFADSLFDDSVSGESTKIA